MARKTGANALLSAVFETTYGTDPTGNFQELFFTNFGLVGNQAFIPANVLGQGRGPLAPFLDLERVAGPVEVPVDVRAIGWWLKLLLGTPLTAGGPTFTHTYGLNEQTTIPSATMELGLPEATAQYYEFNGVVANSARFNFSRSGPALATFDLLGQQSQVPDGTTESGTHAQYTYTPFGQFHGNIKKDGSNLANVLAADVTISNNLSPVETLRSDTFVEGYDVGQQTIEGTLTVRVEDLTLLTPAFNDTLTRIELIYDDGTNDLTIDIHEAHLQQTTPTVAGPGGVELTMPFTGEIDSGESEPFDIVLTNDVATYSNPA